MTKCVWKDGKLIAGQRNVRHPIQALYAPSKPAHARLLTPLRQWRHLNVHINALLMHPSHHRWRPAADGVPSQHHLLQIWQLCEVLRESLQRVVCVRTHAGTNKTHTVA